MSKGKLITFEGIDGCGKSTQIDCIARWLDEKNIPFMVTREPGGTVISEKIRELILSPQYQEMSPGCELFLYLAARAQHIDEKIKPALDKGFVVLCDRFQEATFAYQGFGRGFSLPLVQHLNDVAAGAVVPTRTYIFDITTEQALLRLQKMNKAPDRLEQSSKDFFEKIRHGYLTLAKADPHRIKLLQGEKSREELCNTIIDDLQHLLPL